MRVVRRHRLDRAVLFIGHVIKCRYIDSWNLCRLLQKFLPAAAARLDLLVAVDQVKINHLALAHIEEIKKRRDRLRIVGTRTAADNDRILLGTIFCMERNL